MPRRKKDTTEAADAGNGAKKSKGGRPRIESPLVTAGKASGEMTLARLEEVLAESGFSWEDEVRRLSALVKSGNAAQSISASRQLHKIMDDLRKGQPAAQPAEAAEEEASGNGVGNGVGDSPDEYVPSPAWYEEPRVTPDALSKTDALLRLNVARTIVALRTAAIADGCDEHGLKISDPTQSVEQTNSEQENPDAHPVQRSVSQHESRQDGLRSEREPRPGPSTGSPGSVHRRGPDRGNSGPVEGGGRGPQRTGNQVPIGSGSERRRQSIVQRYFRPSPGAGISTGGSGSVQRTAPRPSPTCILPYHAEESSASEYGGGQEGRGLTAEEEQFIAIERLEAALDSEDTPDPEEGGEPGGEPAPETSIVERLDFESFAGHRAPARHFPGICTPPKG